MALQLYYHPFSSYCQKALIALYDNNIAFERNVLEGPDSPAGKRLAELWPMKRFPVLVDGDRTVIEATCIIEYLGLYHPGPVRMIPEDPKAALETRFMDRFFDNYVAAPQMQIVFNQIRPEDVRDPHGVKQSRGWIRRWRIANGPPATVSAWPIAARHPFCSTPTGLTPFRRNTPTCTPTAAACCNIRRSRAPSTMHGPSANTFRWARRTGTDAVRRRRDRRPVCSRRGAPRLDRIYPRDNGLRRVKRCSVTGSPHCEPAASSANWKPADSYKWRAASRPLKVHR